MSAFERPRRRLIERLREEGIEDLAVLRAFDLVPRHRFVPDAFRWWAYRDVALPIGYGQTISRPLTHALWLQALRLRGRERVLEVGTGSGFQTALLAHLAAHVYTVERVPELARRARAVWAELGLRNVRLRVGDGSRGWPDAAPFHAILVSACAPDVPPQLLAQLAPGGRLLVPLAAPDGDVQRVVEIRRRADGRCARRTLGDARFVPLVAERGPTGNRGRHAGRSGPPTAGRRAHGENVGRTDEGGAAHGGR